MAEGQHSGAPGGGEPAVRVVLVAAPRCGAGLLQQVWRADQRWGATALSTQDVGDDASAVAEVFADGPAWSVEWAPKWSLRIPTLLAADEGVRFVRVVRDPRRAVASLVQAWRTGRFVSEPDLPGWWGEPWSFPLIPEWESLVGKPLHEVAAVQWLTIDAAIRDALAGVDPARVATVRYEELLTDPAAVMTRVTGDLGVPWVGQIPDPLPTSPLTVSAPNENKWQREAHETLAAFAQHTDLHQQFLTEATEREWTDYVEPLTITREPALAGLTTRPSNETPFSSEHSASVHELLRNAGSSIVISTYKSGHLIFARAGETALDTHVFGFNRPMGLAVNGPRLAIGTGTTIESYWNQPNLAERIDPHQRHDAVFVPRSTIHTGDIAIHEMDYDTDGVLWFVNTRFSCLSTLDPAHSFNAAWVPDWITGLAAEDRCHLNGMAMRDGHPTYVTALARTDTAHGWREHKGTSGVIIDITTNQVITEGLSMPHSPRWHDNQLWVLQSGLGTLSTVDTTTGAVTQIAELPGFTRGLAFIGRYALIGLSQVRESVFTGLPITNRASERNCGVWIVDTTTGDIVGMLRFTGAVQEIFDVQVLPGITWPTIVTDTEVLGSTFILPPDTLARIAHP